MRARPNAFPNFRLAAIPELIAEMIAAKAKSLSLPC